MDDEIQFPKGWGEVPAGFVGAHENAIEKEGYKRGLLRAAEMAEKRAERLERLCDGTHKRLDASLKGGRIELQAHAAKCRAEAEKE